MSDIELEDLVKVTMMDPGLETKMLEKMVMTFSQLEGMKEKFKKEEFTRQVYLGVFDRGTGTIRKMGEALTESGNVQAAQMMHDFRPGRAILHARPRQEHPGYLGTSLPTDTQPFLRRELPALLDEATLARPKMSLQTSTAASSVDDHDHDPDNFFLPSNQCDVDSSIVGGMDEPEGLIDSKVWNEPRYDHQLQRMQSFPSNWQSIPNPEPEEGLSPPYVQDSIEPLEITVRPANKYRGPPQIRAYPMYSRPRGSALIIDNELFINNVLPKRDGSAVDSKNLSSLFSQLGFLVELHKNLHYQAR